MNSENENNNLKETENEKNIQENNNLNNLNENIPLIYRAIAIPSSLRSVAPFLEEAQAYAG